MNVEGVKGHEEEEHAQHEKRIANSVNDEGFACGIRVLFVGVPKTNQQVRRDTYTLPTNKQDWVRIGKYQNQHEGNKEIQVREKPRETLIAVHIPNRKDVNQETNTRDNQRHDAREVIERKTKLQGLADQYAFLENPDW